MEVTIEMHNVWLASAVLFFIVGIANVGMVISRGLDWTNAVPASAGFVAAVVLFVKYRAARSQHRQSDRTEE